MERVEVLKVAEFAITDARAQQKREEFQRMSRCTRASEAEEHRSITTASELPNKLLKL